MSRLLTEQLTISYEQTVIVDDLNIQIPDGQITSIIGPNGCGKSTVLKTLARIMKPKNGIVLLDGASIASQPSKDIAKKLAILPQTPSAPEGLTVEELISYGRFPHQKGFGKLKKEDFEKIHWSLAVTKMLEFKDRPIDALSGGQRQRAWIAMALAQDTDILMLDEPTTYLDMAHQLEVLQLLKKLNNETGKTIVMVIHDLNHASKFSDHIIAVRKGKVIQEGTPKQVMTSNVLEQVFQIKANIVEEPVSGAPLCLSYELVTA